MGRGISRDSKNIYPYALADGSTKYQVRLRVHGQRVSKAFDDLDQAESWRDEALSKRHRDAVRIREGEAPEFTPQPRQRGGRAPERNVLDFIRDEWRPTALPRFEGQPTRGRARGKAGAKQLPLAQRTRNTHKSVMKVWIHGTKLASLDPTKVDAQHITEWVDEVRAKEASDAMIRQGLKLLSNAFGWAATVPRQTGINVNPVTSAAWPPEVREKEIHYFEFIATEWIWQWMRNTAAAESDAAREKKAMLFCLMAGTGMRPEEARRVEAAHVGDHFLTLPARISKTGRDRTIPLWAPVQDELSAYIERRKLKPSDPLISRRDGGPMTFTGWEKWRRDAYNPARDWVAGEILHDERLETAVAYDVCRHRYGRAELAALVPPQAVAEAMGHDLVTLSRVYAGPIREANERSRRGRKPYDPESKLRRARAEVAAKLPAELERWRIEKEVCRKQDGQERAARTDRSV
jgi:integrase